MLEKTQRSPSGLRILLIQIALPRPIYCTVCSKMTASRAIAELLGGWGGKGCSEKVGKQKFSEWGLPGVESVATSLESLFMLSRAPQHPYIKKSENFEN